MNNIDKKEIWEFLSDTSRMLSKIAVAIGSNNIATAYAENVEFWQWLDANYKTIDPESSSIVEFLEKKGNHNQFFGKVYEWDYYNFQRDKVLKILSDFDLPQTPNNPGIDMEENSLFGGIRKYQLKGYTSGTPDINSSTTPRSTKIVTNVENIHAVESQGYEADAFMDKESINDRRNEMLEKGLSGEADFCYEPLDVVETIGKSSLFGFVVGLGTEALISYREYKNAKISSKDYIQRIIKSGAERGISAGATSGIMIPINVMLISAGITSLVTIPIAFLIHHTIATPISAAFGKGEYRSVLQEAKIYDSTSDMMSDFGEMAYASASRFKSFVTKSNESDKEFVKSRNDFNDSIASLEKMLGGKL